MPIATDQITRCSLMSDNKNPVLLEKQDDILIIRFNRPEKKNALTTAMYATIHEALVEADEDDSVRAVVFCGQPDMFTAGNDLSDFLSQGLEEEAAAMKLLRQLAVQEKPLVAAASGIAVGIGVTLLLHCDLVYVGENTRMRLPFVNLAVVPEAASSLMLPDIMGRQRASELLMLGDFFDSRKAREYGIVNEVVPNDQVFDHAMGKARQLAEKPQAALMLTKKLITKTRRDDVEGRISEEGMLFAQRLASDEAREVMAAFFTETSEK